MITNEQYTRNDLTNEGWSLIIRRAEFEIWQKGEELLHYNPLTETIEALEEQKNGNEVLPLLRNFNRSSSKVQRNGIDPIHPSDDNLLCMP